MADLAGVNRLRGYEILRSEGNPGHGNIFKAPQNGPGVQPGRADPAEGMRRAAAHGKIAGLEKAYAWIERGGPQVRHVHGRGDPRQAGLVVPHPTLPAPHAHDPDPETPDAHAVQQGHLARGQAVAHRDGEIGRGRERRQILIQEQGTFHGQAVDGVRPVQDDERDAGPGRLFHGHAHRGEIRVESGAGVLDVEDQGVEAAEVVARRPHAGHAAAIEAMHGYDMARHGDGSAADGGLFAGAGEAMLGGEDRRKGDTGSRGQDLGGEAAASVAAGVVGDQADPEAVKFPEAIRFQDVDAGPDPAGRNDNARTRAARASRDKKADKYPAGSKRSANHVGAATGCRVLTGS